MLPNLLVVGAQKCGTSWLHRHLTDHPDVFMPARKELEYFSYSEHLERIGSAGYAEHFAGHAGQPMVGEATASYFWGPDTPPVWGAQLPGFNRNIPAAIETTLGDDVRLVVSLRDPVERAVSAYLHHIAHGAIDPDLPLLDAGVELGVVSMGFYAAHLEHYLKTFERERILVLIMERDIVDQPRRGLDRLADHLNLSPFRAQEAEAVVFPGVERRHQAGQIEARMADGSWRLIADSNVLSVLRIAYGKDLDRLVDLLGEDLARWWPLALGSD